MWTVLYSEHPCLHPVLANILLLPIPDKVLSGRLMCTRREEEDGARVKETDLIFKELPISQSLTFPEHLLHTRNSPVSLP